MTIPTYTEDRYWGKAPKEELARAIALIEQEGWEAFKKEFGGTFDFTFEENRADWRFMLPLAPDWTVLDTGAGMGRTAIPLARVVKKVVAFDSSVLRMKYLALRAKAEGLDNIEVLVADLLSLPFSEAQFDLIVMNGVLEWVGKTDRYTDPREAQIAALKICRRLLKPGGYLYIGIENRFAAAYLTGRDHSGLRFTSYMPRVVANAYLRLHKGERYDTYTYSKRGYAKLLREAGFANPAFYLVYPGYNLPRILVQYEQLAGLRYVIRALMKADSWKRRFAQAAVGSRLILRLYRSVFFSFAIFAKND